MRAAAAARMWINVTAFLSRDYSPSAFIIPASFSLEWIEMTRELTEFAASLERWNLHNHPFYQAWSAGTLPVSALADYARDWGSFVRVIDQGWETLGQREYAAEERVHAELWDDF